MNINLKIACLVRITKQKGQLVISRSFHIKLQVAQKQVN